MALNLKLSTEFVISIVSKWWVTPQMTPEWFEKSIWASNMIENSPASEHDAPPDHQASQLVHGTMSTSLPTVGGLSEASSVHSVSLALAAA